MHSWGFSNWQIRYDLINLKIKGPRVYFSHHMTAAATFIQSKKLNFVFSIDVGFMLLGPCSGALASHLDRKPFVDDIHIIQAPAQFNWVHVLSSLLVHFWLCRSFKQYTNCHFKNVLLEIESGCVCLFCNINGLIDSLSLAT